MFNRYSSDTPQTPQPSSERPDVTWPRFQNGFTGWSSALPSDDAQAAVRTFDFGAPWFKH